MTMRAPAIGALVSESVTAPCSVPRGGVAHEGNRNEPMRVCQQRGELPVQPGRDAE
jgi:hypothetical protein